MDTKIVSTPTLVEDFFNTTKEKHENPEKHRGFTTGIPEIEQLLGGFQLGWYIIVGGAEKSGKTALMLSILLQFAMAGKNFMWVSREMSLDGMAGRTYANMAKPDTGVDLNKLRDLKLEGDDWKEMERIKDLMMSYKGWWTTGSPYVEEVLMDADKKDIDILVVDYIQLLQAKKMRDNSNFSSEIRHISKLFNDWVLAKESEGRPRMLITGSQLNREATKAGTFDSANYFFGTSSIEQDADVAFVIGPVTDPAGEEDPTKRKIYVSASRWSEQKVSFTVSFDGAHSRFAGAEQPVKLRDIADECLNKPAENMEMPW